MAWSDHKLQNGLEKMSLSNSELHNTQFNCINRLLFDFSGMSYNVTVSAADGLFVVAPFTCHCLFEGQFVFFHSQQHNYFTPPILYQSGR